ncbi:Ubiquitin-binding domain containing protein [Parasponia andersonii]|uniref:Ubiquitin-binding domain containing protein n=1 Tax=Parasponia andersonii TaxID=3476 RepID=A0A2P5E514_PARAD|nr:Ubiquitin-binding domain containing protein [Parasponia andersonii]
MGCVGSSQTKGDGNTRKIRKPRRWRHTEPITRAQLERLRDEFWDTAPHYGGRRGDALKAAAEAELTMAQAIVDSAGIIVQNSDLTLCYDERGPRARYELPAYVLSEPTNLVRDS